MNIWQKGKLLFFFVSLFTLFVFLTTSKSHFLEDHMPKHWMKGCCTKVHFFKIPSSYSLFKSSPFFIQLQKRIWNPTIVKYNNKRLMLYRSSELALSFQFPFCIEIKKRKGAIQAIYLDETMSPISSEMEVISQKDDRNAFNAPEDPRLIYFNGELFCLLVDKVPASTSYQDELYLTDVIVREDKVYLTNAKRLTHPEKLDRSERNWMPFVCHQKLFAIYSTDPYEILHIDLKTGKTTTAFFKDFELNWPLGFMSGSSLPISLQDQNITFFHSFRPTSPKWIKKKVKSHYFFGAYIFENKPPFTILSYTPFPIFDSRLYNVRVNYDRIVFPTYLEKKDQTLLLVSGINDRKIAFIEIDLEKLKQEMQWL